MKKKLSLILNLLTVGFGIAGIYFTVYGGGFMQSSAFVYYTVQSNLLVIGIAAVNLYYLLKGKLMPKGWQATRLLGCIAITLTFLVFALLLIPVLIAQGDGAYLLSPGNLCVHNLTPLMSMLDWCLCGSVKGLNRKYSLLGLIPPGCYCIFVAVLSSLGSFFSGKRVPYFFFDAQANGWISKNGQIGVIPWFFILLFALLLMGWGYHALVAFREKRVKKD